MHPKHKKGTASKIAVMKVFVDDGYYVYNEMNNTGPVDFVAIHPFTKQVKLIEVKTMSFRSETSKKPGTMINRVLSDVQKKLGVSLFYHNVDTGAIKYA